jgi:hypothetical protein
LKTDDSVLLLVPARNTVELTNVSNRVVVEIPRSESTQGVCKGVLDSFKAGDIIFYGEREGKEGE